MLKTDKVIVVEGKYDAIKLNNIIDATIFITEGFGVFKDNEKLTLLRRLAEKRGLVILTDPDSAGFLIRNYLKGAIPKEYITNVFIEDIYGKEKRKSKASKEGKLGVEGVPDQVITDALKRAGIGVDASDSSEKREITRVDFFNDGLMGGEGSSEKRDRLKKELGLPERLTTHMLLEVINMVSTYEEYKSIVLGVPVSVIKAIEILKEAGHEAFIVGGCTRDRLMGNTPHDWDMTTSALPSETKAAFEGYKTYDTGIKHGTVSVNIDGDILEITTFRIDENYIDGRHPENVTFTPSVTEDLARRDFTMNAIAWNPDVGFVDPFDGMADIEEGIIRCVGDPDKRFGEDALRILRALRFASQLDFTIDPKTADSIHRLGHLIKQISAERISAELLKLLCGKNVGRILLDYSDVFTIIIPELEGLIGLDQKNRYHIYTAYEHCVKTVENVEPAEILRLSAFLHDIGKVKTFTVDEKGVGHFYGHGRVGAEMAREIAKRLRLSTKMTNDLLLVIEYHDIPVDDSDKTIKRRLSKFGYDGFSLVLKVMRADVLSQNPEFIDRLSTIDTILKKMDVIMSQNPCLNIGDLAINGNDLLELGLSPSPEMKETLSKLLEMVIDGKLENTKEDLMIKAKELISNGN